MRKIIFFLIISIFFTLNVSSASLDIGFTEGEPVVEIVTAEVPINYSTVNVNNSQYFQSYTPTTLRDWMKITFDTLYAGIEWNYNQSLATYNMWNSIWSAKTSLDNVVFNNGTNLPSTWDITNYTGTGVITVSEHVISSSAIPNTNVAFTNESNTFTQPQTFQNITIETKIETTLDPNVCFKFKPNGDVGVSLIC